jgi:hypothetical protein
MVNSNNTFKIMLRNLRSHLRSDVNDLLDTALDMVLDEALYRPPGVCRACRTLWRPSVARVLRKYIEGLVARKEATLYHVEHALERIQDGSYGMCERCDAEIPESWLMTVPHANLCVLCDSQRAVD